MITTHDLTAPLAALDWATDRSAEGGPTRIIGPALTDVLGEVSRSVSDEPGLLELTSRACVAATTLLSGVTWASVMAQPDARPVTVAATDLRALLLDHAQYREDDGPGLSAIRTGSPAVMTTASGGERWEGVLFVAEALGMQWSLALPLAAGGGWIGALNLYGTDPGPVPALDQDVLADLVRHLQQGFDGYLASDDQTVRHPHLPRDELHDVRVTRRPAG